MGDKKSKGMNPFKSWGRKSITEAELTEKTPLKDANRPARNAKDFKDNIKIYLVVDNEEAVHEARKAIDRHWDHFIKKVKKRHKVDLPAGYMEFMPRKQLFANVEPKIDTKQVIIELSLKHEALEYQAGFDALKVQLDHNTLNEWIQQASQTIKTTESGVEIKRAAEEGGLFPSTHYIYAPYESRLKEFFVKDDKTNHFLSEIQQIWLIENIFNFDRMVGHGRLHSYFALHQDVEVSKEYNLKFGGAFWFEAGDYSYSNYVHDTDGKATRPESGPDIFDRIREYYGEQIALYFRFVTHLAKWCIPLGFLGLLCQGYIIYTLQIETPLIAVYAAVVVLWANLFTEIWKRVEAELAYRWGMEGFEATEENRFQFDNEKTTDAIKLKDPVNGNDRFRVNNTSKTMKQILSSIIIVIIMGCVVTTTIAIYSLKSFLQIQFVNIGIPSQFSATCASVLNTVQIMAFKYLYNFIASALNDFENHQTQTEFEDSMISKLTVFSFFNSYISFFYIAFVAGSIAVVDTSSDDVATTAANQCGLTGCMGMLSENLLIVLLTSLSADKITEFVVPFLTLDSIGTMLKCGCFCPTEKKENKREDIVENYRRNEYDFAGRLSDYTTLFVLFGYLVMFSPALPVAAVFVAVSTAWESRGDLMKLYNMYRRVQPHCAEDIGAWQGAFEVITVVGVVSNSGLIVFTMGMFSYYSFTTQMWIFIGMQWFMFTMLAAGGHLVQDDPYRVAIQRQRCAYYNDILPPLYDKSNLFKLFG